MAKLLLHSSRASLAVVPAADRQPLLGRPRRRALVAHRQTRRLVATAQRSGDSVVVKGKPIMFLAEQCLHLLTNLTDGVVPHAASLAALANS